MKKVLIALIILTGCAQQGTCPEKNKSNNLTIPEVASKLPKTDG